jgi:hypothetical protein
LYFKELRPERLRRVVLKSVGIPLMVVVGDWALCQLDGFVPRLA